MNKIEPKENGLGPFDFNLYNLPADGAKKLTPCPKLWTKP
jgi:hypothetical protein